MVGSNYKKPIQNMVRKKPSARMTRLLRTLRDLRNNSKANRSLSMKEEKERSCIMDNYDASKMPEKLLSTYTGNNKPAELYRADLISAMKVPDTDFFHKEEFLVLNDPWRGEWDKGVQVPVNFIHDLNKPSIKAISPTDILYSKIEDFYLKDAKTSNLIKNKGSTLVSCESMSFYQPDEMRTFERHKFNEASNSKNYQHQYNADAMDLLWLKLANTILAKDSKGITKDSPCMTIKLFEGIMLELEKSCYNNIKDAFFKDKEVALEFDENVICDVCRSPDSEDTNEMVFCDICNICVHQACYGIVKIPKGSWLCNPCSMGVSRPKCLLCPNPGGAMKPTKSGMRWCHVSCALWIPEIGIADPDKMEPITKISQVPPERWNLVCVVCREKHEGACIQCSVKSCRIAFHVTCGFKGGLDMKADWNHDDSMFLKNQKAQNSDSNPGSHQHPDVKLKAYCPKHSRKKGVNGTPQKNYDPSPTSVLLNSSTTLQASSNIEETRFEKLKQMEAEFYAFVDPKQEINKLLLPIPTLPFADKACYYPPTTTTTTTQTNLQPGTPEVVPPQQPYPHPSWLKRAFSLTYNYWKLKRRQRFNVPLVSSLAPTSSASLASSLFATYGGAIGSGTSLDPESEEAAYNSTSQQLESNLYHRLKMCVQLRQDLERVRNLSYMLIRREKLAASYVRARNAVFDKQAQIASSLPPAAFNQFPKNPLNQSSSSPALLQTVYQAQRDDSLLDQIVRLRLPHPPEDEFENVNVEPTFYTAYHLPSLQTYASPPNLWDSMQLDLMSSTNNPPLNTNNFYTLHLYDGTSLPPPSSQKRKGRGGGVKRGRGGLGRGALTLRSLVGRPTHTRPGGKKGRKFRRNISSPKLKHMNKMDGTPQGEISIESSAVLGHDSDLLKHDFSHAASKQRSNSTKSVAAAPSYVPRNGLCKPMSSSPGRTTFPSPPKLTSPLVNN